MDSTHSKNNHWSFSTKTIHVGQKPDPTTGAVIPPIYATSTFSPVQLGEYRGYDYSRTNNPTRETLELVLASIEHGNHGIAFSSGLAACSAVLHLLNPGEHIIASNSLYGGVHRLLNDIATHNNIRISYVDMQSIDTMAQYIDNTTRLAWVETPSNPLLTLIDLKRLRKALPHNILIVVDNTFATPYLQNPLDYRVDVVVHSTTKYINGHSDVIGGAVVVKSDELAQKIRFYQNAHGAVPGPFDSWLTLRGLKTLEIRMEKHIFNASSIANFLERCGHVENVLYPGLITHPQHELAKLQMRGPGGIVSFYLRPRPKESPLETSQRFLSKLRLITLAASLGGVESLIQHPASTTHAFLPADKKTKIGILDNLVRLSVGIENLTDLITDLEFALKN